jgi:hypothetical protein
MATNGIRIANDYPGDDMGAQINAADADLGSSPGIIIILGGTYSMSTRVILSEDHTLKMSPGVRIELHTTTYAFLMKDRTSIIGSGWSSIIVESDAAGDHQTPHVIIRDYNAGIGNDSTVDGNSDLIIEDIQFVGANPYFDSATSAITLGNSHRAHIRRCFLNGTRALGITFGGASSSGYYASDFSALNNTFYNVASQNLNCVNGKDFKFLHNTLLAAGQAAGPGVSYIDLEPNTETDIMENFVISNNIIDARDAGQPGGNGIIVQAYPTDYQLMSTGPGIVSNNTIIGRSLADSGEGIVNWLSNGIVLSGNMRDVAITNNVVRGCGQAGINVNDWVVRAKVSGNQLSMCGGGGNPAMTVGGSYGTYTNNTLSFDDAQGSQGNQIIEIAGSDYNYIAGNYIGDFSGARGTVTIIGANTVLGRNQFGDRPQYASAAPTTLSWVVGDIVYNTTSTAGGFIGWVCTTAGTPGTWKTFGAISP